MELKWINEMFIKVFIVKGNIILLLKKEFNDLIYVNVKYLYDYELYLWILWMSILRMCMFLCVYVCLCLNEWGLLDKFLFYLFE